MSLVNHQRDPNLREISGIERVSSAEQSQIREIHIGFANLMPDSAYFATLKQWAELVNLSDTSLQIYLHPIHLNGMERRDEEVLNHVRGYTQSIEEVLQEGVDAMIITGGDLEVPDLLGLPFIEDFRKIVDAIDNGNVTSGLFACLAEHIRMKIVYGVDRTLREKKILAIQPHEVPTQSRDHFLKRGLDTHFEAVHARRGDLVPSDITETGMIPLDYASEAPHSIGAMIDSKFKFLGIQTHAEYSALGFLQEYLRDLERFNNGEELELPFPNCLTPPGEKLLRSFIAFPKKVADKSERKQLYQQLVGGGFLKTTWKGTGNELIQRWVSGVLKITGYGRHEKYDSRVNPEDPHAYLR